MDNRYDEAVAAQLASQYAAEPPELALRVYTSRLLGAEPGLVLHGGGNTSVKGRVTSLLGEEQEVIWVKGSGWDLASIEPQGFAAVDLAYLRRLRALDRLDDEAMVNAFRTHLLDAKAPTPSIETLVHAFLPHAFVDHTHADAILVLTNQPHAAELVSEALGPEVGILPFIMPGFPLAKAVAELYAARPGMEALVLAHHGLFTFGGTAREAYERMIQVVSRAEAFIAARRRPAPALIPGASALDPDLVLPILRGALANPAAGGRRQTWLLAWRHGPEVKAALAHPQAFSLLTTGVVTPDHVIRTKNRPLFLELSGREDEAGTMAAVGGAVAAFRQRYDDYFAAQAQARGRTFVKLDTSPRVILVPGLGLAAAGASLREAGVVADIAERTLVTKTAAAAVGIYQDLDEATIFGMEYWSLEQAKLGRTQPLPLAGKVALVTGGGGAVACGVGRQLLAAGAQLFLADLDAGRLAVVQGELTQRFPAERVATLVMDVTDPASVARGLSAVVAAAGGLDILVPNAGVAHVAPLAELELADLSRLLAVNLVGVFLVMKASIPVFRRQGTGGHVVIISSKNVLAPGAAFGAYSASKAGAHQLGRIAALELAALGVRVNMVNPDAVFAGGAVASGLWETVGPERMRARNLDPAGLREFYRSRSLLKTEVTAEHVGNAVVFFASDLTPTTGASLPVDAGIPEAFPR
ncbi:MAG: bifunctional aldolase/short-chain dehydrogenase [Thermodesulfobacteriota bacterium]